MGLLLFPVIARHLEASKRHEKAVFLSFGFLNCAMRLPDQEYHCVPVGQIDDAIGILNESYEKAFGVTAQTYNFHIVASHLKELREQGPLTRYTAYPFEGSYAELRRSFQVGTRKSYQRQ